jgi:UDP-2,3-diacylglucosamine pyrophosphatase LpxH
MRTLWISDLHLGTPACRAAELSAFLDRVTADRIYLTGDIVDLEYLSTRARFPRAHWSILKQLVRLAGSRTEIVWIPGNHDFELRELAGRSLCGIDIALEAVHTTADGRRLPGPAHS